MDPATISTLASIGLNFFGKSDFAKSLGGVLGSIGSLFGSDDSSEAYLQANRETNAMNYKIWQEQMAHNTDMYNMQVKDSYKMYDYQYDKNVDMWNMQNEYNSPKAMRERYEEAGLNPYLAMSGGSNMASAVSSPSMSQPSMATANAPTMQAPSPAGFPNKLSVGLEMAMQQARTRSEVANTDANTNLLGLDTQLRAEDLKSVKEYNKYLPEMAFFQWENAMIDNRIKRYTEVDIISISHAQNTLQSLDAKYQSIASQYFSQSAWIRFASESQLLANAVAQERLTIRQAISILVRDNLLAFESEQNISESESREKLNLQEYNLNRPAEIEANATTDYYNSKDGKKALKELATAAFWTNYNQVLASKFNSQLYYEDTKDLFNKSYDWTEEAYWRRKYKNNFGQGYGLIGDILEDAGVNQVLGGTRTGLDLTDRLFTPYQPPRARVGFRR